MAKKRSLKDPDKKAAPKAAYLMPPPNESAEAYNWELRSLRAPDPKSENKKDPDAGQPAFRAPQETAKTMLRYGHDAQFICPKYLQILLDQSPEIREATMRAAEARYTQAAIEELQKTVNKIFHSKILPDIVKNFEDVSLMIAQFYAARLAHIKKFGHE